MKRLMHVLLLLFIGLNLINSSIHAELLIVKHDEKGFSPLTLTELKELKCEEKLGDLLDKYQWPTCIASNLDEKEQEQLLTVGEKFANAEERFIEQKINDTFGKTLQCGVIFIPTTIYELFCLEHGLNPTSRASVLRGMLQNALNDNDTKAFSEKLSKNANDWWDWKIELTDIINQNDTPTKVWGDLFNIYRRISTNALMHDARFYTNQILAEMLFQQYPTLTTAESSAALSDALKRQAEQLAQTIITNITSINPAVLSSIYDYISRGTVRDTQKRIEQLQANLRRTTIIPRYIALEYEARAQNKALLVRGTSHEEFQVGIGKAKSPKKVLAGTTLRKTEFIEREPISFERAYGEKKTEPYSISFSNSLFSGVFVDPTACTYFFLSGSRVYGEATTAHPGVGYAVLIDKKAYKQHRCNRLFFISPLPTLAAMAQGGEYFHSRSTTALAKKPEATISITGLFGKRIKDPTGVLLITRDPLKHAALFSQYLADNGRFIESTAKMPSEEKEFAEKTAKAQAEAAKAYGETRRTFDVVRKGVEKQKATKNRAAVKGIEDIKKLTNKKESFDETMRLVNALRVQGKQYDARELLEALVESGRGSEAATKVAVEWAASPSTSDHMEASRLWEFLLEKGIGIKEAHKAAVAGWRHWKDFEARCEQKYVAEQVKIPIGIWEEELRRNDADFSQAWNDIRKIQKMSVDLSHMLLEKMKQLVEQGQHFDEAKDIASDGIKNPAFGLHKGSLALWEALFKQEKGFEEAHKILNDIPDEMAKRQLSDLLDRYNKKKASASAVIQKTTKSTVVELPNTIPYTNYRRS